MNAAKTPARRLPGRLAAATAALAAGLSMVASAGASDDPATAPTPAMPSGLTAYAVGDGRVLLDWQDSAVPYGRYQVYRDGRRIADGPIRSDFLDEGLQNGRVYEYRVS